MDLKKLEESLAGLRKQLNHLETHEAEKIRHKRIEADMDDDYRENEGAKLVMEDHNMWFMRKIHLMREITETKRQIHKIKYGKGSE